MFQNKRRRYSHESRRDTVRRRPLPGIGAVRDPGRCQVDLLLGARTPRGRARQTFEKDVERVWRDSGKVYGARKIRHALGHEAWRCPAAAQPDHEGERHGRLLFQGRL